MDPIEHSGDGDVTGLLRRHQAGDPAALDLLFPLVYDELRAAAARALEREHGVRPLQATELVHEAYLKLAGPVHGALQGRSHFVAIAARAMRQILVDQARRRRSGRRGGDAAHVTLADGDAAVATSDEELLALDDALERLARMDVRLREVVELRFFGGLTERETAAALGVTERTVQRDWARARAWLHKEIYSTAGSA
ncbi:MAG TPA: ECF-type sigma factor [Gemmatimonadales bacterium]